MTNLDEAYQPSQQDFTTALVNGLGFKERRSQEGDRRTQQRRHQADDRRISDHSYQLLGKSGSDNRQRGDRHAPKDDRRKSFGAAYLLPRRLRGERRQGEDRRAAA